MCVLIDDNTVGVRWRTYEGSKECLVSLNSRLAALIYFSYNIENCEFYNEMVKQKHFVPGKSPRGE